MGLLAISWRTIAGATAITALSGCLSPQEGAAVGSGLGAILAEQTGVQPYAGAAIGAALGSAIASQQVICEGTTSITREARRDNRTGAVIYDITRQNQDRRCTGGRTTGTTARPIQPIF